MTELSIIVPWKNQEFRKNNLSPENLSGKEERR